MGASFAKCCLCYCFKICVFGECCRCPPLCRSLCECCEFADCCEVEEDEDYFAFADEEAGNSKSDDHGEVAFLYENGDSYKGQISNGKRHGIGELTLADGSKLRGYFKDDEYLGSNSDNRTGNEQGDNAAVRSEQEAVPDSSRLISEDTERELKPLV